MDESDKLKSGKITNFLKKNVNSLIFLIILAVIISIITYLRVLLQIQIGPLSDSIDFFTDSLVFAGQGFGYSDLLRPPFFSFITSIFVRIGFTSINTIFAVDGGFFVFGVIGLFLLLKLRFNEFESFFGSLLYATFPIVIAVLGVGFSDLASVSITIWTFYFMILAVKRDSRYFYLSFPFAMIAFLTRYNSALIIFPIFLYIFINWTDIKVNKIKNIKNMLIGILISFSIIIPALVFFYHKFGNAFYPFISFSGTVTSTVSSQNASYDSNLLFFIQNFPYYIGIIGVLIILISAVGITIYGILRLKKSLKAINEFNPSNCNLIKRIGHLDIITMIKFIFFIIISSIFIGTFGHIYYMCSEIIFVLDIYLFYHLTKRCEIKYFDMDILFFAWFMAFFIFQSTYIIKDNRYFVIMNPPVAYFLLLGLSEISRRIQFKIKNINMVFPVIATILTVIILISTLSSLPIILEANNDTKVTNEKMVVIIGWLESYDPDYKNKNIYSDMWPNFSWYLKTNVKMVPIFKGNQTYSNGVKNDTFNNQDSMQFNNYLVNNNAYYYLSIRQGLNLTSYTPIKKFGNLIIYKKKS